MHDETWTLTTSTDGGKTYTRAQADLSFAEVAKDRYALSQQYPDARGGGGESHLTLTVGRQTWRWEAQR